MLWFLANLFPSPRIRKPAPRPKPSWMVDLVELSFAGDRSDRIGSPPCRGGR